MVVIAVALGNAACVVGEEAIALSDHDVAIIAGFVETKEVIHLVLADYFARFGVISAQAVCMGDNDAGGQLGYLGLSLFGFEAFV